MKWMLLIFAMNASAAISSNPSKEPDFLSLAWNSFDRQRYEDCLKFGQKAKLSSPALAAADIVLGRCEERLGHFPEAHRHFKSATESEPKNADAWNNRVLMSIKDVRIQRAKNELRLFISSAPSDKRIVDLQKMIRQLEEHLKTGEMSEQRTRQSILEMYLQGRGNTKD